ncbi:MAG: hypothetical protein ACPGTO_05620 [Polaribacter sp.]
MMVFFKKKTMFIQNIVLCLGYFVTLRPVCLPVRVSHKVNHSMRDSFGKTNCVGKREASNEFTHYKQHRPVLEDNVAVSCTTTIRQNLHK